MKRTLTLLAALTVVAAACGSDSDDAVAAAPQVVVETDDGRAGDAQDEAGSAADVEGASGDRTDEEIALEFVACMGDNGVDLPDPTVNADGTVNLGGGGPAAGQGTGVRGTAEFQEAFDACGGILEGANFLGARGDRDQAEFEDDMLAFAQCLRDQGLDVDDPDLDNFGPGSGGGGGLFGEDFDPQDPANEAYIEACQSELGEFGGRFGGGNGG